MSSSEYRGQSFDPQSSKVPGDYGDRSSRAQRTKSPAERLAGQRRPASAAAAAPVAEATAAPSGLVAAPPQRTLSAQEAAQRLAVKQPPAPIPQSRGPAGPLRPAPPQRQLAPEQLSARQAQAELIKRHQARPAAPPRGQGRLLAAPAQRNLSAADKERRRQALEIAIAAEAQKAGTPIQRGPAAQSAAIAQAQRASRHLARLQARPMPPAAAVDHDRDGWPDAAARQALRPADYLRRLARRAPQQVTKPQPAAPITPAGEIPVQPGTTIGVDGFPQNAMGYRARLRARQAARPPQSFTPALPVRPEEPGALAATPQAESVPPAASATRGAPDSTTSGTDAETGRDDSASR